MLAALLLFSTEQAGASITIEERAMPLGKLVDRLAAELERPLTVQAALRREWVIVNVREANPDELLDHLAEVVYARWEEDGKTLHLRRSPEADREGRVAGRKFLTKGIRDSIAKRRRQLPPSPELAILFDLLEALPLEGLVDGIQETGIAYAEPVTGLERPFPPAAAHYVERFAEKGDTPAKVTLHLEPMVSAPGQLQFLARLQGWQASGGESDSFSQSFGTYDREPVVPQDAKPVEITPVGAEIERFRADESPFSDLSPTSRRAVLYPEEGGRIAWTWTDLLRGIAHEEGRLLVASLPDEYEASELFNHPGGTVPRRAVEEALLALIPHRTGRWLTYRPAYPIPLDHARADRAAVGRMIRKVIANQPIDIEEAANLFPRIAPLKGLLQIETPGLVKFQRLLTRPLRAEPWALALYAALPPPVRRHLLDGHGLAYRDLPPAAQAALRRHCLDDQRLGYVTRPIQDPGDDALFTLRSRQSVLSRSDVLGLRLEMTEKATEGVIVRTRQYPNEADIRTYDRYARMVDARWNPIREPGSILDVAHDGVRPCRQREITLTLRFPSGYSEAASLEDIALPTNAFAPPARLPDWVKLRVRP